VISAERDAFTVIRSLPHGHVVAALGTARRIGLDRILDPTATAAAIWCCEWTWPLGYISTTGSNGVS
jgi:hypothetical protein